MADPRIPVGPIVTQEQMDKAQSDKLAASLKGVGIAAAGTKVNQRLNAPGGPVVQFAVKNLLTGVSVVPGPGGRGTVSIGKSTFLGALLPAPYGYVPPETYGLHPSFTEKAIGKRIPLASTFGFRATEDRVKVYEAKEYVAALAKKIEGFRGPVATLVADVNRNAEPLPGLSLADYVFLRSLPPGSTRLQFYVTQYGPRYEALLADAVAEFERQAANKPPEFNDFGPGRIPENPQRTARAPDPQFDDSDEFFGIETNPPSKRVADIIDGFALRVAAAKKSMDP